jgi:hypothetical protein
MGFPVSTPTSRSSEEIRADLSDMEAALRDGATAREISAVLLNLATDVPALLAERDALRAAIQAAEDELWDKCVEDGHNHSPGTLLARLAAAGVDREDTEQPQPRRGVEFTDQAASWLERLCDGADLQASQDAGTPVEGTLTTGEVRRAAVGEPQRTRLQRLQRRWAALDYDHDIRAGEAAFDLEAALVGPEPEAGQVVPQQPEHVPDLLPCTMNMGRCIRRSHYGPGRVSGPVGQDTTGEAATMSRYRKKPVEIEAQKFGRACGQSVANWCGGRWLPMADLIEIPTLEGTMTATLGDYIIKGVQGEFYPCKPDIFAATYEPVSGDTTGEQQR